MRILEILSAPWAMPASRVEEIRELYFAHTRREKIDLRAWEAATGRPSGSERAPYQLVDGVAVIPIQGILTKVDSAWNRICGMTSTVLTQQDLQAALDDPNVKSILLWVDSPGGMVDGTQELADAVFAARGQKRIVALADGCMCSAAYWVGAAAERIYITSDTTEVGSIGVVAAHTDVSGQQAQQGVKTTEITAGKYKRIASAYAPLSDDGRAAIQAQVDHIYSVFIDSIAKFRGLSVDTVLADMADGRVFLGRQAIDAGLVDGVSTMAGLISQLNQERTSWTPTPAGARESNEQSHPTIQEENQMVPITREQLSAEAPDLLATILAEGRAAGAAAETQRFKGCLDSAVLGYEPLALAAALDGKTTPAEASQSIIAAQRADEKRAKAAAERGPNALPGAGDAAAAEAAQKNAEAAAQAADAQPKDAKALAAEITAHIARAAAEGRTLTAAQASAELNQGKE